MSLNPLRRASRHAVADHKLAHNGFIDHERFAFALSDQLKQDINWNLKGFSITCQDGIISMRDEIPGSIKENGEIHITVQTFKENGYIFMTLRYRLINSEELVYQRSAYVSRLIDRHDDARFADAVPIRFDHYEPFHWCNGHRSSFQTQL